MQKARLAGKQKFVVDEFRSSLRCDFIHGVHWRARLTTGSIEHNRVSAAQVNDSHELALRSKKRLVSKRKLGIRCTTREDHETITRRRGAYEETNVDGVDEARKI
jgi:hypothetical protein